MDLFSVDKIYSFLKHGETLEHLMNKLEISQTEALGMIEYLKVNNKRIDLIEDNGNFVISKRGPYKIKKLIKPDKSELNKFTIGVISDTHYGSKQELPSFVSKVYRKGHERGIKIFIHCGDFLDGDFTMKRREQIYQIFAYGSDEQIDHAVNIHPEIAGIITYFIQGSHDETHLKNGGSIAGKTISAYRKDLIYLGQDRARLQLNNVDFEIEHPGGGSAKAMSYNIQNAIEKMDTGDKPNILLEGHYHKRYEFFYRNVHGYLVPCATGLSNFMNKFRLQNTVGAYFLTIYSDDKGNVEYIETEYFPAEPKDIIEDDYKTAKKLVISA